MFYNLEFGITLSSSTLYLIGRFHLACAMFRQSARFKVLLGFDRHFDLLHLCRYYLYMRIHYFKPYWCKKTLEPFIWELRLALVTMIQLGSSSPAITAF